MIRFKIKEERCLNGLAWLAYTFFLVVSPHSIGAAPEPDVEPEVRKHPNIILILADDFGVGDIQAHFPENPIPTPHLDRLVENGMSFTDAHSPSAVCSPTRYGMLTGRYAWRTSLQEWVLAAYEPPLIKPNRLTLPGFLQKHGYHTSLIGKWHLGWDWPGPQLGLRMEKRNGQKDMTWDFTSPIKGGPVDRGFHDFFGLDLPNMPPFTWIENDRIAIQPTEKYVYHKSQGVVMPRNFQGGPIAPDWKFDAIMPEITRKAVERIHRLSSSEKPFFLFFSQTAPHEPVSPSEMFRGKSGIAPIADFVMETDWSAGQIIQAVEDAGIEEDTLIIFTADNGHSHYTGWDELIAAGHMPSAHFRGHKGNIWEGGHRVPLVIQWKGKVQPGSSSKHLVSLTDFFATFADLIHQPLPKSAAEDSESFLPSLLGNTSTPPRGPIVNHSNHGEFAYREGDLKLVLRNQMPQLNQSRGLKRVMELYNLHDDPSESHNLVNNERKLAVTLLNNLQSLVSMGSSRKGAESSNDVNVNVLKTQEIRYFPEK